MDEFFTTNVFILLLLPSSFVVGLALVAVADRDISRAGVMFWGVALIALAGYIASQLIAWQPIGEFLIENKESGRAISRKAFEDFQRKSTFMLWVIPFVTGSLGTNLISDALMNHGRYQRRSRDSIVAKIIVWVVKKISWSTLLFLAASIDYILSFLSISRRKRKWRVKARLYRRRHLRKYSKSKQPWQL